MDTFLMYVISEGKKLRGLGWEPANEGLFR